MTVHIAKNVTLEIEIWKPVESCLNIEASNMGRIRTIDHVDSRGARHKGRIRKTPMLGRGYPCLSLRLKSGKRGVRAVHVLVCEAFYGPRPDGMQVRHLDGDKMNNVLSNLRYGTASENHADRVLHGVSNRGERCGTSKLLLDDVVEIRALAEQGLSHRQISEKFNVSRRHVGDIVNREKWAWLPPGGV